MKTKNFVHVFYQNDYFRMEGSIMYDSLDDVYMTAVELIPDDCKGGIIIFSQEYTSFDQAIKQINHKVQTFINTMTAGVKYVQVKESRKECTKGSEE